LGAAAVQAPPAMTLTLAIQPQQQQWPFSVQGLAIQAYLQLARQHESNPKIVYLKESVSAALVLRWSESEEKRR
jgi:hypothetical protein